MAGKGLTLSQFFLCFVASGRDRRGGVLAGGGIGGRKFMRKMEENDTERGAGSGVDGAFFLVNSEVSVTLVASVEELCDGETF